MMPKKVEDNDSFKSRKGKIGGYVDHLNSEELNISTPKYSEADLSIY